MLNLVISIVTAYTKVLISKTNSILNFNNINNIVNPIKLEKLRLESVLIVTIFISFKVYYLKTPDFKEI